jgi:hypothetical protein
MVAWCHTTWRDMKIMFIVNKPLEMNVFILIIVPKTVAQMAKSRPIWSFLLCITMFRVHRIL